MPLTLELDFNPLMSKVKALQYKASSETKAHLKIMNDKTNSFLDSLQELKAKDKGLSVKETKELMQKHRFCHKILMLKSV